MLEEIRIRDLGVIEESVLELAPGFTAVTGETGAGKTMVVTALGLLAGGRADSGAVRAGAERARVEGVVDLGRLPPVVDLLEEAGAETEDGRVLLARQVSAEGRSRAYAGGAGVPAGTLAQVADALLTVHGQSDQHRLLRPGAQRDALDAFAGPEVLAARREFGSAFAELRRVEEDLGRVRASRQERAREADMLRFGLEEVERVAPQPGEEHALAAEESRLGFADTLRTAAERARALLSGDDDGPDAVSAVGLARRELDGVRDHDPEAAALADRVAEVGYVLTDLAGDVASYAAGVETDPARLAAVSGRRAELAALTRKYGESAEEVLAWAATSAARLQELDGTDDLVERLEARCTELRATLAHVGTELTRRRLAAADGLAAAVTEELHALAMPHARLTVAVTQQRDETGIEVGDVRLRPGPSGLDDVEILLAANVGAPSRPVSRSASGGELSRVMLALEVVLADSSPVPTMVFDEVDAGVGGRAAVEVGRRLARLARTAQVVVVTHLPQVAAFADRHVVVTKSNDGRVTRSGLVTLDDAGRVRELSRMLAGQEDSATARAHAQELLEAARAPQEPASPRQGTDGKASMPSPRRTTTRSGASTVSR